MTTITTTGEDADIERLAATFLAGEIPVASPWDRQLEPFKERYRRGIRAVLAAEAEALNDYNRALIEATLYHVQVDGFPTTDLVNNLVAAAHKSVAKKTAQRAALIQMTALDEEIEAAAQTPAATS